MSHTRLITHSPLIANLTLHSILLEPLLFFAYRFLSHVLRPQRVASPAFSVSIVNRQLAMSVEAGTQTARPSPPGSQASDSDLEGGDGGKDKGKQFELLENDDIAIQAIRKVHSGQGRFRDTHERQPREPLESWNPMMHDVTPPRDTCHPILQGAPHR